MEEKFNALNGWTLLDQCVHVFVCTLVCFLGGVITGFGILSAGRNLVVETCVLEPVGDSLSLSKASLSVSV